MYEKMYCTEALREYVAYPVGLMCIPTDIKQLFMKPITAMLEEHFRGFQGLQNAPVIMFQNLSGWRNDRPMVEIEVESYITKLTIAVDYLNQAGVAHMDLRPSNIMWQWNKEMNSVDIQIIDFEDAVTFGSKIRFVEILKADACRRYPIMDDKNSEYASAYHNNWFLVSIKLWLKDEYKTYSYSKFMQENHILVLHTINEIV